MPPDWKPIDESNYLPLQDAANRYGLTYQQLHKLIHYGHVQCIHEGRYVLVDIASLKDWLPPPGWAWLHDAAKECGVSYGCVRRLVKKGQVRPNRWWGRAEQRCKVDNRPFRDRQQNKGERRPDLWDAPIPSVDLPKTSAGMPGAA